MGDRRKYYRADKILDLGDTRDVRLYGDLGPVICYRVKGLCCGSCRVLGTCRAWDFQKLGGSSRGASNSIVLIADHIWGSIR